MIRKNVTLDGANNINSVNTPIVDSKSINEQTPIPTPAPLPLSGSARRKKETKPADSINKKLERHTIVELKIDTDTSVFDAITAPSKLNHKQTKEAANAYNVKVNKDSIDFIFIFLKTYDILLKKDSA